MLTPAAPGVSVEPIINVGESLPSGYTFESIPDGISLARLHGHAGRKFKHHAGDGERVAVWVNHDSSQLIR